MVCFILRGVLRRCLLGHIDLQWGQASSFILSFLVSKMFMLMLCSCLCFLSMWGLGMMLSPVLLMLTSFPHPACMYVVHGCYGRDVFFKSIDNDIIPKLSCNCTV